MHVADRWLVFSPVGLHVGEISLERHKSGGAVGVLRDLLDDIRHLVLQEDCFHQRPDRDKPLALEVKELSTEKTILLELPWQVDDAALIATFEHLLPLSEGLSDHFWVGHSLMSVFWIERALVHPSCVEGKVDLVALSIGRLDILWTISYEAVELARIAVDLSEIHVTKHESTAGDFLDANHALERSAFTRSIDTEKGEDFSSTHSK